MENHIVLKFGNRRVVLNSPDGRGTTYTKHLEGYSSFAFDGCDVVGSVIVDPDQDEPTLHDLLTLIRGQQVQVLQSFYKEDFPGQQTHDLELLQDASESTQ